ncbi:helix-turn-helix domain-containing protein [Chryseobacterium sp. DT-3]|uniref:helix-turn-helix domain-containing protein n=1 Tax=Chryseobacterium sp. DT-3 TaxID=3396164 RepID=UPI003F1BC95C
MFKKYQPIPKDVYENVVPAFCSTFNTSINEIKAKSRTQHLVEKRMLLMYLLRRKRCTVESIAFTLDLHHSTVLYHLLVYEDKLKHDRKFREFAEESINNLKNIQHDIYDRKG